MKTNTTDSISERRKEREAGRRWVASLDRHDVGELGDQFVCGDFDWREWLGSKPSPSFLRGADDERIAREIMGI